MEGARGELLAWSGSTRAVVMGTESDVCAGGVCHDDARAVSV